MSMSMYIYICADRYNEARPSMAWPWFLFEVEHGAGAREVTGGGWGGLEALSVGGGGVFCPISEFMPVS